MHQHWIFLDEKVEIFFDDKILSFFYQGCLGFKVVFLSYYFQLLRNYFRITYSAYGNFLIAFTKSWEFSFLHSSASILIWTVWTSTSLLLVGCWSIAAEFICCKGTLSVPFEGLNLLVEVKFVGAGICSRISVEFSGLWWIIWFGTTIVRHWSLRRPLGFSYWQHRTFKLKMLLCKVKMRLTESKIFEKQNKICKKLKRKVKNS